MTWMDCRRWIQAAINDGWMVQNGDPNKTQRDSLPVTITLDNDPAKTFLAGTYTRPWTVTWTGGTLYAWGPDGLSIVTPVKYPGQGGLFRLLLVCPLCFRTIPQLPLVKRWSYAGRCCQVCFDEMPAHQRQADPR